jgi:hypothetical protein
MGLQDKLQQLIRNEVDDRIAFLVEMRRHARRVSRGVFDDDTSPRGIAVGSTANERAKLAPDLGVRCDMAACPARATMSLVQEDRQTGEACRPELVRGQSVWCPGSLEPFFRIFMKLTF